MDIFFFYLNFSRQSFIIFKNFPVTKILLSVSIKQMLADFDKIFFSLKRWESPSSENTTFKNVGLVRVNHSYISLKKISRNWKYDNI